jgi:D-glycero-alpha-D-manno-heptose-7-phosphate kinase
MIISRTPFRISFAGGGTDLPAFYRRGGGAVTSTAIDKYMFITCNRAFDHRVRVAYSQTEIVEHAAELRHPIVREALKLLGIDHGIEITSIADVPAQTGLGSSSSFAVGLLNALYAFKGEHASAEQLARDACHIEIEVLGEPIGKQDQYIAAYGGWQHIQFNADESVFVDPIVGPPEIRREIAGQLLMFYTGRSRRASDILTQQKQVTGAGDKQRVLEKMRGLAVAIRDVLRQGEPGDAARAFGRLLHEGWELKRSVVNSISNPEIDGLYERARKAGALGGKLLGAGGGGFLLFFVERDRQPAVREALKDLRELRFRPEPQGSKIVYYGG